jgi:putative endonuclease
MPIYKTTWKNVNNKYWVYILLCENNSYYTGYTIDLVKRYQSHVNGTGKCKYTRSFKPVCIAQYWEILGDKVFAMKMERYIKKLSHQQKEEIIAEPSKLAVIDARVKIVSSNNLKKNKSS